MTQKPRLGPESRAWLVVGSVGGWGNWLYPSIRGYRSSHRGEGSKDPEGDVGEVGMASVAEVDRVRWDRIEEESERGGEHGGHGLHTEGKQPSKKILSLGRQQNKHKRREAGDRARTPAPGSPVVSSRLQGAGSCISLPSSASAGPPSSRPHPTSAPPQEQEFRTPDGAGPGTTASTACLGPGDLSG